MYHYSQTQTLTDLDLNSNGIGVSGARWIANLLKTNTVRQILDLFITDLPIILK